MTAVDWGSGPEWREVEDDAAALNARLVDIHRPLRLADASGNAVLVPAVALENLGDRSFCRDHGLGYAYVSGAMANGIASVELVETMARAKLLGFFGAAGLSLEAIDRAIERLAESVGDRPHGFNLIHTPSEPEVENAVVDLYLRRGVRLVEASAYLDLTLPLIRYRLHGIRRGPDGSIVTPNRVIAKASRVEVAEKFFSPPPERFLQKLIATGELGREEAELARRIPIAEDLTAEADSGGHTDNRPAISLLPTFLALRDRLARTHDFDRPLRVGAAGGIATPHAAAAAFSMGAAYVLSGTVNQSCVESGSSDLVRAMLAEAGQADIAMAPAPDMFEMGVKVQVLKRGTMFAMRSAKLYELYRAHDSLEAIPAAERAAVEKNYFRNSIESIWDETRRYFLERDPSQVDRAATDAKHKMALVFRWYLGLTSRWANAGEPDRKIDYQIWCGPAMGAFNEWVRGSFLEQAENRRVVTVALNILHGAAVLARANTLRLQGIQPPAEVLRVAPMELRELEDRLQLARAKA